MRHRALVFFAFAVGNHQGGNSTWWRWLVSGKKNLNSMMTMMRMAKGENTLARRRERLSGTIWERTAYIIALSGYSISDGRFFH